MSEIKVELKKKIVKGKIVYVIVISAILLFAILTLNNTNLQQLAQGLFN